LSEYKADIELKISRLISLVFSATLSSFKSNKIDSNLKFWWLFFNGV